MLLVADMVTLLLNRSNVRRAAKTDAADPPAALAFLWNDFVATLKNLG
jgi:hypothetical protein